MRQSLAAVALAVTSMIALSFLIPLAILVMSLARDQNITAAEQRASAMAPVLALTTNPAQLRESARNLNGAQYLVLHLPGSRIIGTTHAPPLLLRRCQRNRESVSQDIAGGWIYLQPVVLAHGQVAVVEEFVPRAELTRGVASSWTALALLAVGLVIGSVVVADRLASRVVRSSRELARASNALGHGRLGTRVEPMGPKELQDAGRAFNTMADRMAELLAIERELVADLSHRLRTPLTALHLACERMRPDAQTQRITAAVDELESELHTIITAARNPLAVGPMGRALRSDAPAYPTPDPGQSSDQCEVAPIVSRKAGFWAVLAEEQQRSCTLTITEEPTPIGLSFEDVAAVVDAVIGNIFRHTSPGTAFAITVNRTAHAVELVVDDAGPGIVDPDAALARGHSNHSTGLGLDIVRRAASATAGSVHISRSPLGGACIRVTFGLLSPLPSGSRKGRRGRRAGRRSRG
ncbi:ATP-binding protein [Streptomyces sp. NPDC005529]|uniref:HAMP domain-containing sensor histidine kinase n=1 Tax=unclassified Streptomyces TaxID=2593676 RepID=UPI0033AD9E44